MRDLPEALRAAARSNLSPVARADVWYGGQMVAPNIAIVAGTIAYDDDATIRAQLSVTIADPTGDLVPMPPVSGLNIYGHELHLRTGLTIPGRGETTISAGWYPIRSVKITEGWNPWAHSNDPVYHSSGAILSIEASDRAVTLDDARFLAPEQPPPGATCGSEIKRLAAGIVPIGQWPRFTDRAVPGALTYDESRLEAIAKLAKAADARVFCDDHGNLIAETLPTGDVEPVATFTGGDGGTLISLEVSLDRDRVYNAVVARGEGGDDSAPIQAIAYESDPRSPTRWDGPYGRVPLFYSSPVITTYEQAAHAAATRLNTSIRGRDRIIDATIIPHPGLEVGDVVRLVTPRMSYVGRIVTLTYPLSASDGLTDITVRVAPAGITTTIGQPLPTPTTRAEADSHA